MESSYLFVGLGGALGAVARVTLQKILPSFIYGIPLKILCINVIGCFAIGLLSEVMAHYWNPSFNIRHFLIQGFLGGFTTFSAFTLEFGLLYEKGNYFSAFCYALLSVFLTISCFFFGAKIINFFLKTS